MQKLCLTLIKGIISMHLRQNILYSEDVNKNPLLFICSDLFKCVFDISVSLSAKEKNKLSQKTKF